MRFVSQSVLTGFVNALAILIFLAQVPQLVSAPMAAYVLIALGLAIIYAFPYLTKAVPSPLIAIAALTVFVITERAASLIVGSVSQYTRATPS